MERKIKFIMVGNTMVGKSALLLRLIQGKWIGTIPTVGIEFRKRKELIDQNDWVVELWDTTGQERFKKVVSQFFRGIHGAILVFDLTNERSLEAVPDWIKEINNVVPDTTPKVLFGNKADLLEGELPLATKEKIDQIVKDYNLTYFQGSVKTGDNVQELYTQLLRQAYSRMPAQLKIVVRPTVRQEVTLPVKPVKLDSSAIRIAPEKGKSCC